MSFFSCSSCRIFSSCIRSLSVCCDFSSRSSLVLSRTRSSSWFSASISCFTESSTICLFCSWDVVCIRTLWLSDKSHFSDLREFSISCSLWASTSRWNLRVWASVWNFLKSTLSDAHCSSSWRTLVLAMFSSFCTTCSLVLVLSSDDFSS